MQRTTKSQVNAQWRLNKKTPSECVHARRNAAAKSTQLQSCGICVIMITPTQQKTFTRTVFLRSQQQFLGTEMCVRVWVYLCWVWLSSIFSCRLFLKSFHKEMESDTSKKANYRTKISKKGAYESLLVFPYRRHTRNVAQSDLIFVHIWSQWNWFS